MDDKTNPGGIPRTEEQPRAGVTPRPGMASDTRAAAPTAPQTPAAAPDIGPSPGPDFVRIRWTKAPTGNERVGGEEWAEHRRAASLVKGGHAEYVKE